METKPRTIEDIDDDFTHSAAIVSSLADMIATLGSSCEDLCHGTLQSAGVVCYEETQKLQKLYGEQFKVLHSEPRKEGKS